MKHLDIVTNLASAVAAWRSAFWLMAVVTVAQAFGLIYTSNHTPVTLIPHTLATAKGPVKVTTGDTPLDAEYLAYLAMADLQLILNWTPDNVSTQYSRFLNRATPRLYAAEQVHLLEEAKANSKAGDSQAFYALGTKLVAPNTIEISGSISRWAGEKQVLKANTTYIVRYQILGGLPYVDALTAKN